MNLNSIKKKLKKSFHILYDFLGNVRHFFQFSRVVNKLKKIEKISNYDRNANKNKVVVFNLIRTYISVQFFIELIFALKLSAKGYKVVAFYDDGVLNHHETLTKSDRNSYTTYYGFRRKVTLYFLKKIAFARDFLMPYSSLNISVSKQEVRQLIDNEFIYEGIDLFEYIEASLVRFFLSAPDEKILKAESDYKRALEFFSENALLSYKLAKSSIEIYEPDLMVTSHGIYTTWGVFMKKYQKENIKVITYGGNGYTINGVDFGINDISANKIDNGFFEYFTKNTNEESKHEYCNIVDDMMAARFSGASSDTKRISGYVNGGKSNLSKIERLKEKDKKVFALFPNVMWDNATTFKDWNTVFSSPVEWLVETVKFFLGSDDKVLVIRVHPAEYLWMDVRVSIEKILITYFGEEVFDSENIVFIPPEEKILSYDLFPLLTAGIVYNGTIGLELMYQDVPLITGARTAYSNKGFTKDITAKDDYFYTINHVNVINSNKLLLKLFIYEYFFLHGVPLKVLSSKNLLEPNLEEDVKNIWDDENLDYVIDVMMGKQSFFQKWYDYE